MRTSGERGVVRAALNAVRFSGERGVARYLAKRRASLGGRGVARCRAERRAPFRGARCGPMPCGTPFATPVSAVWPDSGRIAAGHLEERGVARSRAE